MSRLGIYWRLRDVDTPWVDKVKLVRYAWTQPDIHIPNKHQVLLDWLALELTGKKRVKAEESEPLWRCFRDMVHSPQCQKDEALILRNVVGQVLTGEVRAHGSGSDRHCSDSRLVTSCISGILTSPGLRAIFTYKLEAEVQLTKAVLQLILTEGSAKEDTTKILDMLLAKLSQTAWIKVNTTQVLQVVCESLLITVCKFKTLVSETDSVHLHQSLNVLQKFIACALFPKGLSEHYKVYVGLKNSSDTASKGALPKDVEKFFSSIEKHLKSEERDVVLGSLPTLYAAFLEAYQVGESPVWFHMLTVLVRAIGVDVTSKGGQVITCRELTIVSQLLQVVLDKEAYSPALDYGSGKLQLTWFQQLGNVLLDGKLRSGPWFDCIRLLLLLDHQSLETRLDFTLSTAWANVQELPAEAQEKQGALLGELVTLYGRLRRFPTLISKCLSSLRDRSVATPLSFPKAFHDSLVSIIGNLLPSTCVTLWQSLLNEIETHYKEGTEITPRPGLTGALHLLSILCLHARLADSTVPHQVAAQISDLMKSTRDCVVAPLIGTALHQEALLVQALCFTRAWGELHVLLLHFTKYSAQNAPVASGATSHHDLTLLHGVVSAKQWQSVFKKTLSSGDEQAKYALTVLVSQKVRALLLLEPVAGVEAGSHLTSITNAVAYITAQVPHVPHLHLTHTWGDAQVGSISPDSHQVALMTLVYELLPLIVPFCTGERLLAIADVILAVSSTPTACSDPRPNTLQSATHKFLRSATWQELGKLHSVFISAVSRRLHTLVSTKPSKSPKKQKLTFPSPGEVLLHIGSRDIDWYTRDSIEESRVMMEDCAGKVMKVICSDNKQKWTPSPKSQLELINILKLFDIVPLEFLQGADKARCLLIFLAMASSNQPELVKTSLNQMLVVLDSPSMPLILPMFEPCKLLLWLIGGLTKEIQKIVKTAPQSNKQSWEGQLKLIGVIMGAMKSVAERTHQKAVLKNLCRRHFRDLCSAMLGLFDELNAKRQEQGVHGEAWECAITSYRHMLDHICLAKQKMPKAKIQKQKPPKSAAKKSKTSKVKMETEEDMEDSSSSSSESESSAEEEEEQTTDDEGEGRSEGTDLDSSRNSGGVATVADDLLFEEVQCRLTDVCDILFNILEKSQDAALINSCLPLISSIGHNYTTLKSELKDGFIARLLTLLLEANLTGANLSTLQAHKAVTCHQKGHAMQYITDVREVLLQEEVKEAMDVEEQAGTGGEAGGLQEQEEGEEEECWKQEEGLLQARLKAVAALMSVLDVESFTQHVHKLLNNMIVENLDSNPIKVLVAMGTLRALMSTNMSKDSLSVLRFAVQDMVLPVQELVRYYGNLEPTAFERHMIREALAVQVDMLSHGKTLMTPAAAAMCLHTFLYLPLEGLNSLESFSAFHQMGYYMLDELLVKHEKLVLSSIPTYIRAAKRLMTSVMLQGDQERRPLLSETDTQILVTAALNTYRLLSAIAVHKVSFAKVAAYIVSDYVEHLQKITLLPRVKKSLIRGIHDILNLCDMFAINQLRAVLPAGGKEIFRALHLEFTKYYKYMGRV